MRRAANFHPAQVYNEKRGILFRTVHNPKKGFQVAFEYLEGYRSALGLAGYVGLRAELKFYQKHRKDYRLTVAGDMGEHADFVGHIGNSLVRIDVTTNIEYKSFRQYERFLCEGFEYKLAVLDEANFEIVDVLDLAFPPCERCGASHLFPFLLLLGERHNDRGESTCVYDQLLLDICPHCETYHERTRFSHHSLQPVHEYARHAAEYGAGANVAGAYAQSVYAFAKKLTRSELMGLAETYYDITGPRGDGDWITTFPFRNALVADRFSSNMYLGILD